MSTLLMSSALIEPLFGASPEAKEYYHHSFSESILNFGQNSPPDVNMINGGMIGCNYHHLSPTNVSSLHHMVSSHPSFGNMVKCEEQFEEYHHEYPDLCMVEEYHMALDNNWLNKPPDQWHPMEVAEWIRNWARRNEVQDIEVAHLLYNQMPGSDLCQMHRDYFTSVCPQYGNLIYESLQSLQNQFRSSSANYLSFAPNALMSSSSNNQMSTNLAVGSDSQAVVANNIHHGVSHSHMSQAQMDFFPHLSHLEETSTMPTAVFDAQTNSLTNYSPSYTSVSESDRESTSSNLSGMNERKVPLNSYYLPVCLNTDETDSTQAGEAVVDIKTNQSTAMSVSLKKNGRRGRPPKKEAKSRSKGNGKLWEFIRDLLLNPVTNPSLIRWERREDGIFKFIQSDKVAKMWGERKQNPRMTYEKLSRAMRYYYKSQVLLPVFGRRLVYKFGPNATGWRPQHDHHVKQINGFSN